MEPLLGVGVRSMLGNGREGREGGRVESRRVAVARGVGDARAVGIMDERNGSCSATSRTVGNASWGDAGYFDEGLRGITETAVLPLHDDLRDRDDDTAVVVVSAVSA